MQQSSQLLQRRLLFSIVTGDERWFHISTQKNNDSTEWHYTTSPKKKKARNLPLASTIMGTVF
jgi:hypothetical protein